MKKKHVKRMLDEALFNMPMDCPYRCGEKEAAYYRQGVNDTQAYLIAVIKAMEAGAFHKGRMTNGGIVTIRPIKITDEE